MVTTLHRPEYTGDNRCWPCTIINSILLVLIGGVFIYLHQYIATFLLVVCGIGSILLRGYFIPYTPKFAPWLMDQLPGDRFHTDQPPKSGSLSHDATGEEILDILIEFDIVMTKNDQVHLDKEFRDRWREEMKELQLIEVDTLVEITAETTPSTVDAKTITNSSSFTDDDDRWIVLKNGSGLTSDETWLSIPVAIAEVAAVRILSRQLSPHMRTAAAHSLRMFLKRCPACCGTVKESTEACCGRYNPDKPSDILVCMDCGQRLFTFPDLTESNETR